MRLFITAFSACLSSLLLLPNQCPILIWMKRDLWILFSCLVLLTFSSRLARAYAQKPASDQFSLAIYPPLLEINAKPPSEVKADFQIQNLTELTQSLDIKFKQFRSSESRDGTIKHINEELDPMILRKIKIYDREISIEKILLDPYQSRNLTLNVSLDENAPLGDYYFSVIFLSSLNESRDTSGSQIPGGIGTNIILSVGDKGPTRAEIKEFSVPGLITRGPVPITLLLQNNSNHYILPQGRIITRDMLGREAGQVNILPQYILANSARFMIDSDQASASTELAEQIENLSGKNPVLIWPKRFLFGLYTVTAYFRLSQNDSLFETKTFFIAIPLYAIFTISFFAFVLIGIYLKVRKRSHKNLIP